MSLMFIYASVFLAVEPFSNDNKISNQACDISLLTYSLFFSIFFLKESDPYFPVDSIKITIDFSLWTLASLTLFTVNFLCSYAFKQLSPDCSRQFPFQISSIPPWNQVWISQHSQRHDKTAYSIYVKRFIRLLRKP